LEIVAVIAKYATINSEPYATTAFFDTNIYLFLLLFKISQHCFNSVYTVKKESGCINWKSDKFDQYLQ